MLGGNEEEEAEDGQHETAQDSQGEAEYVTHKTRLHHNNTQHTLV